MKYPLISLIADPHRIRELGGGGKYRVKRLVVEIKLKTRSQDRVKEKRPDIYPYSGGRKFTFPTLNHQIWAQKKDYF